MRPTPAARAAPAFGTTDLLLLTVVLAFGLNYRAGQVAGRLVDGDRLDARALCLLRMLLVVPVLLPLAAHDAGRSVRALLTLTRREALAFAALGFAALPLNQFLFLWGMQETSTIHGALLFSLSPILAALIAHVFLDQRGTTALWIGLALGLAGVALVVSRSAAQPGGGVRTDADPALFGDALILASATGWAVYTAASAPLLGRRRALETTALALVWGLAWCVVLFGAALWDEVARGAFARVTPLGWGGILYVSYAGALYGWVVWMRGVERLGPARTMLYQYLVPLVAMGLGVLLFDEALEARALAGGVLVVTGLVIGRRARVVATGPATEGTAC